MRPRFFARLDDFRKWLEEHHARRDELIVGYYKKASGKASITWEESVDEALCFGWIDGIRRKLADDSYTIRFTPRRARSNWSKRNVERVEALISEGRMHPPGLKAFGERNRKEAPYSFEQRNVKLDPALERRLKASRTAWKFFSAQPPGYRRDAAFWVQSAKREETRVRRLETLIADSAAGRKIKPLRRPGEGQT